MSDREYDTPLYYAGDITAAADVDPGELQSWLGSRGREAVLRLTVHDREARGRGRPRLFTLRVVIQIAVMKRLVDMGLAPKRAADVAERFTDQGEGPSGWVGEEPDWDKVRHPGRLFRTGETFLFVSPPDLMRGCRIVRVTEADRLIDLFGRGSTGRWGQPGVIGGMILHLNPIVGGVRSRLGLPFEQPDYDPREATAAVARVRAAAEGATQGAGGD